MVRSLSSTRTSSVLTAAAVMACLTAISPSAIAQGAAPLSSMPMPPSASDPAPKEKAKPKAQTRKQEKRKGADADAAGATVGGEPAPARTRRGASTSSTQSFERPSRYVPEEFDRGASEPNAKPFMSESGRPGMGMKF